MTGYISPFASMLVQKQAESDAIARQIAEFEARGGKIQYFNQGDKSDYFNQKGSMSAYATKRSPK